MGAYECGVYKALKRHELEFDIMAGTSIGAINAAIIAGNNSETSAKILEQFWLSLAKRINPSFLEDNIRAIFSSFIVSLYGNKNMFEPVWFYPASFLNYYSIFSSYTRIPPHLYDVIPWRTLYLNSAIPENKQIEPEGHRKYVRPQEGK